MKNIHSKSWSSYIGFVLSVMGAAIGLGNIWKFPYMVGENGGSAFVLIYLICIVIMGLPVMLAEMILGRFGHNSVSVFENLSKQMKLSDSWKGLGWLGNFTLVLMLSFYCVIASFSLAYLYEAIRGIFENASPELVHSHWIRLTSNPYRVLLWSSIFLYLTLWVVAKGVQKGLEKANLWLMPALLIILLILVMYAISLPGAKQALDFMFGFRFKSVAPSVVISAMGHAFFTLAIGAGCVLVYGSYLPKQYSMVPSVILIALMNVVVAFSAGMAIYPLVFTFNLPPEGGPSLMFEVLPIAFGQMQWGYTIGILFFLMLVFAAWTSAISFVEPLVVFLEERYNMSRIKAISYVGIVAWMLGLGSVFSFNIWKNWHIIGNRTFFLVVADLATNILLPMGGLLFSIFIGWIVKKDKIEPYLMFSNPIIFKIWYFLIRYPAPCCIILVLLYGLF